MQETKLKIGISQIAPVWLNKQQTVLKIIAQIDDAGSQECQLVVFGEGLLPGYPFWVELTDGARFNSDVQKEFMCTISSRLFKSVRAILAAFAALHCEIQLLFILVV
jgi:nitrilase